MSHAIHSWPATACCPEHAQREAIAELCQSLDTALGQSGAGQPASSQLVRAALAAVLQRPELLRDAQREGNAECYRRHLLAADPEGRYAIAALVWEPGQHSPVHGHHTWCGYAVLAGTLTETLFSWDADNHRALRTRSHARASGAVSFVEAGRGAIHQLGNASTSGERAISLHIYGVAGTQLATHVNDLLSA
jgi:predicted metal-dependent enzyme (double-stranded beta helix superfamily)